MSNIESKQNVLMKSLIDYFEDTDNLNKMLPIRNQMSDISLRVLDWFVTNYSKNNKVEIDGNFDVHRDYKSQLKAFQKKNFDPFCRRDRINFYYGMGDDDYIETTVGQLNFFRWIISNGVLEYVRNNLDKIENDMVAGTSSNKKKKGAVKINRKKGKANISATGTYVNNNVKITVTFD